MLRAFSIVATGMLFLMAGASQAGISYCGPVSHSYTRHLQWEMDHTDKQGQNRKQVKEEKKVLDGEWYVCLGGSMVGNAGMFNGENRQQDFTFTATDDWLDQRTTSDSRTSKKENNRSLSDGQQGYMRGMLALDCPEGHKVPGKKCVYTLDLSFGTG